jgi:hypothetical protein
VRLDGDAAHRSLARTMQASLERHVRGASLWETCANATAPQLETVAELELTRRHVADVHERGSHRVPLATEQAGEKDREAEEKARHGAT